MKICAAQTRPVKGDIESNIEDHLHIIEHANSFSSDIIIFPELSLTGYEPTLARDLALSQDDQRLDIFQEIANKSDLKIGVGAPIQTTYGLHISMVIFRPWCPRKIYSKEHLHEDELPYFYKGRNESPLLDNQSAVGLAICYELSQPQHTRKIMESKAGIYVSSVAKTARGMAEASLTLRAISVDNSIPVMVANCIGLCDGEVCGGHSAVWNNGQLITRLNDKDAGILVFDTQSGKAVSHPL